jgi:PAS domain S-box-containing protein
MISSMERKKKMPAKVKKKITKKSISKKSSAAPLRRRAEKALAGSKKKPLPFKGTAQELIHALQVHQAELEMQNEELRRAQEELQASHQKYIDLYDFAPAGYFTFDKMGRVVEANLSGARMLGVERAHLLRSAFAEFIAPEYRDVFRVHRHEVLQNGREQDCELKLIRSGGSPFVASVKSLPVRDNTDHIRSAFLDITVRKEAQNQIEAEHRFREAIENSLFSGISAVDLEGRHTYVNPAFCRMVGWSKEELLGATPPFPYWPPEEKENIEKALRAVLRGGKTSGSVELRLQKRSGERFDALLLYSALKDQQENIIGWVGSLGDITEIKRKTLEIEKLNRELEDRVRQRTAEAEEAREKAETILKSISDGFVGIDREWRYTYANEAAGVFLKKSASELIGKNVFEAFPEVKGTIFEKNFGKTFEERVPVSFEAFYPPLKSWFECHCYPSAEGISVFFSDKTEEKAKEEDLARQRELLQRIINEIPIMITIYEPSGGKFKGNREFQKILGWSDENLGDYLEKAYPDPAYRRMVREFIESSEPGWRDLKTIARDGTVVDTSWAGIGLTDRSRVGIGIDMRERRKAEKEREAHLRRISLLLKISQEILAVENIQGMMQKMVNAARELTGARIATSGHDFREGSFRVVARSRAEDAPSCPPGETLKVEKGGVYLELITKEDSLRLSEEELRNHPSRQGLPENHVPLRGLLGTRLTDRQGRANGLLMVTDKTQGDFTEEDEILLGELAAIASLAMQHLEARQDLAAQLALTAKAEEELQIAWQATNREQKRLQAILDTVPSGVVITEKPDSRVSYMNRKALEIYGREDLLGMDREKRLRVLRPKKANGELFHPEELPLNRALNEWRAIRDIEMMIKHPGGKNLTVTVNASPLFNDAGEITGAVGSIHDISQRKSAEMEIQRLNEMLRRRARELEEANQDLEAFTSTAAHDLKTPLIVINNLSQRLLMRYKDELDAKDREYFKYLQTAGRQMMDLVEDLLEFSRIGKSGLKLETLDLSSMAEGILEELRKAWPAHAIHPRIAKGMTARGDKRLVHSAVKNLLENAFKFTNKAERPSIEFGFSGEGEKTFYIRDNGCGFDMAEAHLLFIPFKRLHKTQEYPGSGIGLAAVKRVIERHGGKIWAESQEGKGATFYFTLPGTGE